MRGSCIVITKKLKKWASEMGIGEKTLKAIVEDYIEKDVNHRYPTREQLLASRGSMISNARHHVDTSSGSAWRAAQEPYRFSIVNEGASEAREEERESLNPNAPRLISGGAKGADTMWQTITELYMEAMDEDETQDKSMRLDKTIIRPNDFLSLGRTGFNEQLRRKTGELIDSTYKAVAGEMGKKLAKSWDVQNYLKRDIAQALEADGIYAVGRLQRPGKKIDDFTNRTDHTLVAGGTGYAVQAAIHLNNEIKRSQRMREHFGNKEEGSNGEKEIHVFDINEGKWYRWDPNQQQTRIDPITENPYIVNGDFVEEETPRLTRRFAGIGTRDLEDMRKKGDERYDNALNAIVATFRKTFGNTLNGVDIAAAVNERIENKEKESKVGNKKQKHGKFTWRDKVKYGEEGYEVSSVGDKRFSPKYATFKEGTKLKDIFPDEEENSNIGGMSIEDVYQNLVKKSGKNKPPAPTSRLYTDLEGEEAHEFTYNEGYLPLWRLWAEQNPGLIEELRRKAAGKVLTDKFGNEHVSQARALAQILNESEPETEVNVAEARKVAKNKIPVKSKHGWIFDEADGEITRENARNDTRTLYIFTDNTDRDSGKKLIEEDVPDSWYLDVFGRDEKGNKLDLHFATVTMAILRGLPNAFPFSTQKHYTKGADPKEGRWSNNHGDIELFKKTLDKEIDLIKEAWRSNKYDRVIIPAGGFFNTRIANINTIEHGGSTENGVHTEGVYEYLARKLRELELFIANSTQMTDELLRLSSIKEEQQRRARLEGTSSEGLGTNEGSTTETSKSSEGGQEKVTEKQKAGQKRVQSIDESTGTVAATNDEEEEKASKVATLQQLKIEYEEQNKILEAWKRIFQNENIDEVKRRYQTNLDKLTRMGLNRQNINDMANFCATAFSDVVDDCVVKLRRMLKKQLDPTVTPDELVRIAIKKRIDRLNDGETSHAEVFDAVGFDVIATLIKRKVDEYCSQDAVNGYITDGELIKRYERNFGITGDDAWDMLEKHRRLFSIFNDDDAFAIIMQMALPSIQRAENIRVDIGDKGKAPSIQGSSKDKEAIDMLVTEDELGDYTEGWNYNAMSVNPYETLRGIVRNALVGIPDLTHDGHYVMDSIGQARTIDEQYVHATIINECAKNVIYPDDYYWEEENPDKNSWGSAKNEYGEAVIMHFPVLEKLQERFPSMKLIISKLETNGQLRSAFYSEFRKNKLNHTVIAEDSGNSVLINHTASALAAFNTARNFYERGVTELNGYTTIWNTDYTPNTTRINALEKSLRLTLLDFRKKYKDVGAAIFDNVDDGDVKALIDVGTEALNSLGFDMGRDDLESMFNEDDIDKILSALDDVRVVMRDYANYYAQKRDTASYHLFDACLNDLNRIGENIGKVTSNYIQLSVNQGGVQMQSYVAPNYIGNMLKRLKDTKVLSNGTMRKIDYLHREFGMDSFLYDNETKRFRTEWLKWIDEGVEKDGFRLEDLLDICEVSIIGKTKLPKCTPHMVLKNAIAMYMSFREDSNIAWYLVPNYSDAPSSNFIRNYKFIDHYEDIDDPNVPGQYIPVWHTFEDQMRPLFRDLVLQELSRMKRVQEMEDKHVVMPSNLGKRGKTFCFMPLLNDLVVGDIANLDARVAGRNMDATFLERIIELNSDTNVNNHDDAMELIDRAVDTIMETGYNEFRKMLYGVPESTMEFDEEGKHEPTELEEEIFDILDRKGANTSADGFHRITKQSHERLLREYYWNSFFATSQIYQLCCTDLAYYKDDVDVQKRFKQLHVFGTKLNIYAKFGREYEHVVYLADDNVLSTAINSVKKSLYKAVEDKRMSKHDADTYIDIFKKICSTDGQAYRSVKSYQAVMSMLGKWTPELEAAIERLRNGKFEKTDLDIVFEPIKPYVFTNINTPDGLGGYLRTPVQHKNSEVMLMSTFGTLAGILGQSAQLKALGRYMDDNGIDVAMFASACKVGSRGVIDINSSRKKVARALKDGYIDVNVPKGYGKAKEWTKKRFTISGTSYAEIMEDFNQRLMKNENGDYEDGINPNELVAIRNYFKPNEKEVERILDEHIFNVVNYEGSSVDESGHVTRTGPIDIMEAFEIQDKHASEAERNRHRMYNTTYMAKIPFEDYSIVQPTMDHMVDTYVNIGSQYQNLILAGLPDTVEMRVRVAETVTDEKGNTRQIHRWETVEMSRDDVRRHYQALFTENLMEDFKKVYGKFSTIENLSAALKGMVEQNPLFGPDLLNALEIVEFNGKKVFNIPLGSPQMLFQVSAMINSMFKKGIVKQRMRGGYAYLMSDYGLRNLDVRRDKSGRIVYAECLLPAWSKEAFKEFMNEDGTINIKEISERAPKLLEMVGYRTPTEGKWSMVALHVVDFLPPQCGNVIVLPNDLIAQFGHDFDIDKMFLMMHDFFIDRKTGHVRIPEYREVVEGTDINRSVGAKENDRSRRNNRILDLTYAILTSPGVDVESNSPNSFENIRTQSVMHEMLQDRGLMKRMVDEVNKRMEQILADPKTSESRKKRIRKFLDAATRTGDAVDGKLVKLTSSLVESLAEDHSSFLSDFVVDNRSRVNMLSPNAYIRFFEQNMAGKMLVSIFAVHNTSYCKMQGHGLWLKPSESYVYKGRRRTRKFRFSINGREVDRMDKEYIEFRDHTGQIIGRQSILKNLGEFVAASVDNGKDPLISKLGINPNTGGLAAFLLRAGFTIEEMGIFLSHPAIKPIMEDAASIGLDRALELRVRKARRLPRIDDMDEDDMDIDTRAMLKDIIDSANGVVHGEQYADNNKRLLALLQHIVGLYNEFNAFVKATRPDSVNGTIKNTISSSVSLKISLDALLNRSQQDNFPFIGVDDTLKNGLLLGENGLFLTKDGKLDIDRMREILGKSWLERVQAYYTFGIEAATILPAEYFHQLSPFMNNLIVKLSKEKGGALSDNVISAIHDASTVFLLTSDKFFGTRKEDNGEEYDNLTYAQRRYYYMNMFPSDFYYALKEKDPEIDAINELGFIKRLRGTKSRGRWQIGLGDGARVNGKLLEDYMNDLVAMLGMGDKAKRLAVDLFKYCFYKDGFKFGPNSFSRMFSSRFLSSVPGFVDVMRGASDNMRLPEDSEKGSTETGTFWDRFEDQLYSNMYASLISKTLDTKKHKEVEDAINKMIADKSGNIVLNRNLVLNKYWKEEDGTSVTHKYIRIRKWSKDKKGGAVANDFYLKQLSSKGKSVTYGFFAMAPVAMLYDANTDSQDLALQWYSIDRELEQNKKKHRATLNEIRKIEGKSALKLSDSETSKVDDCYKGLGTLARLEFVRRNKRRANSLQDMLNSIDESTSSSMDDSTPSIGAEAVDDALGNGNVSSDKVSDAVSGLNLDSDKLQKLLDALNMGSAAVTEIINANESKKPLDVTSEEGTGDAAISKVLRENPGEIPSEDGSGTESLDNVKLPNGETINRQEGFTDKKQKPDC